MRFKNLYEQFTIEGKSTDIIFKKLRDFKLLQKGDNPNIDIDKFVDNLNSERDYENPREDFIPTKYKEFEDWFLRKLSPTKLNDCISNAKDSIICSPVQGKIRDKLSDGDHLVKKSILSSKEMSDLMESHKVLQISLRKS